MTAEYDPETTPLVVLRPEILKTARKLADWAPLLAEPHATTPKQVAETIRHLVRHQILHPDGVEGRGPSAAGLYVPATILTAKVLLELIAFGIENKHVLERAAAGCLTWQDWLGFDLSKIRDRTPADMAIRETMAGASYRFRLSGLRETKSGHVWHTAALFNSDGPVNPNAAPGPTYEPRSVLNIDTRRMILRLFSGIAG